MDRDPWPSTYDRHLDLPGPPAAPPGEPIDGYRRLVANPLLPVAAGIASIFFIRMALQHHALALFLLALGLLFGAIFFAQFHCLDCGATGWLATARRHACPPMVARWREGRRGRWPFPAPRTQMILWAYLLASVATLWLILFVLARS